MSWIGIIVSFAIVENVVLARLLGVCPCAGAPLRSRTAIGIGIAAAALMSVSALASWSFENLVFAPLGLGFLRTPTFVLTLGSLSWLIECIALRISPALLRAAGYSLPALAVNCATLGVALIVTRDSGTALESLVAGMASGAGYLLVIVLMSAIRERLEDERVPRALRGIPISLISAGLMALAFMAFDRAFLTRIAGM